MPHTTLHLRRFIILLIVGGVLVLAYVVANTWLENRIQKQLDIIPATVSEISVNLITRSVKLLEFEINPSDTDRYRLRLKEVTLQGLDLSELWNNNKIAFHKLQVDSGKISFNKSSNENTIQEHPATKFNDLMIQNVLLNNIAIEILSDTAELMSCVANVHASGFATKLDSFPEFSTETFDGAFEKIAIHRGIEMYHLTIQKLHFNSQQKTITVDSLLLIPLFGKFEFAHHKGEQAGRINLSVPKIVVEGFDFPKIKDTTFHASMLKIESFDLYSFKDKRVPFLRNFRVPLPMESFANVRYAISVDSLVIKDSRVTLEEITENGAESGAVVIDQINAACGEVTNQYRQGGADYVILNASGYLMNSGQINAIFTLPLNGSPVYHAKGAITKLPFEKLNPALENIARFRIESGKLNNLTFDFHYTDRQSVGTIEIDYEGLKVTGLKKKSDDTHNIKTLLFNTIIKNTKNQALPESKRTGSINIERDQRRYIFNIWWKSILDGLRSAILGIETKKSNEKTKKNKND